MELTLALTDRRARVSPLSHRLPTSFPHVSAVPGINEEHAANAANSGRGSASSGIFRVFGLASARTQGVLFSIAATA
jgi:hypothetical protein